MNLTRISSLRQCIFVFFLVAIDIRLLFANPLKIVDFTYRRKQLELIDITISANVITLELDQDVYHKVQCPIEHSEANRARYVRCCDFGETSTDCFTPSYADHQCMDGNKTSVSGAAISDVNHRYAFKIENYQSCHSITILSKAFKGQVFLAVSIRKELNRVRTDNNDYFQSEYGSNALSFCCYDIRTLNPAWDGEINALWKPYITTDYEFSLWTDQLLPVTEFFMLPPVDVKCDEFHFAAENCRKGSGCLPTPATDDPMFSTIAAIAGYEKYTANPNRFSTGIVLRRDQFVTVNVSTVVFPFPVERFSDLTCIFTFPTLANNQSEILGNAVGIPFENRIPCDPIAFNDTLTAFRERIGTLGSAFPSMYQETNEYFFRALLWVTADAWTSCTDLVDRRLLQPVPREVTLSNSRACLESNRSAAYLADPCCNPTVQRVECCAPRDVTAITSGLDVSANSVADQCQTPRCVSNVLADYIVLSASTVDRRTGCAARSTETLATGVDVIDELKACVRSINVTVCTSDANCNDEDARSICLPSGVCSAPCQRNEDCATNVCEVVAGAKNNLTSCQPLDFSDISTVSSEIIMSTAWRCLELSVDPFSILFVKQDLGLNAETPRETVIQTLVDHGLPTCLGLNSVADEFCDTVRACNWAACNSVTDPYCNVGNCTDPNLGSDHFCGACKSSFCVELSRFERCEYSTSTSEECAAVGGEYNGLSFETLVEPKCIRPTTMQSQCFPPEFCSSTSSCATKRCYQPEITALDNCTTTTDGTPLSWVTWTVNSQTYGLCTAPALTSYTDCIGDAELQWWPGTTWVSGALSTQEECEMLGFCGEVPMFKSSCEEQFTCSIDSSITEQTVCESTGSCNDFIGCVFPWDPIDFSCGTGFNWTPLGCESYNIADIVACGLNGGQWYERATNRQECESKAVICREPKVTITWRMVPNSPRRIAPEISLKSPDECRACGGVPVSYYAWSGGQWSRSLFVPFEWRKRDFIRSNVFVSFPTYDYFNTLLSASVARRYAKSLESDLWCRYGQFASSLSNIVCDCASDGEDCFSGVSSSVVGVSLACSYIDATSVTNAATIRTRSDFEVQGNDCLTVRVSVMPMSQFAAKQVSSLSAAAVSSIKSQQRRSVLFLRNDASIVIGQVIADGILINRDPQQFTGTLEACITFPIEFVSELNVAEFQWAVPNEDFTAFTLTNITVQRGEVSCFPLTNNTQIYFPVGLQLDWQTATFASTLFAGEVFFLVMGLIWYLLIIIFTANHFVIHIMLKVPEAPFFNLSTTALLLSLIFLINRFIYLAMNLSGAMDLNPQVEVVFSAFPALLFYVIYSIIVIRWAEIYHFTLTAGAKRGISKLRPAIIALNSFLVLAFVLLIILFFSLQDFTPVVFSCATSESTLNELSVGDVVSIVYKAFFAAVSAVLSALFVIYGARVLLLMRNATKKSTKTKDERRAREKAFKKLMAVSAVCTLALLAQAVFLLWSSATSLVQDEGRFYGILAFLYLTEMPPAVIFVVMFKKASVFIKGDKNSASKTLSGTADNSVQLDTSVQSTSADMRD